jgi:ligand-binding sensor domain-containing protein
MKLKGFLGFLLFVLVPLFATAQQYNYRHYTTRDGLPSSTVYSVVQDDNGFVWFSTSQGITRFDGYKFKTYTVLNGLPDNDALAIIKGKYGRLWIITFSKQLAFYDLASDSILVFAEYNLPAAPVNVAENEDGQVFVGSATHGLCVIKGDSISVLDTSQLPLLSNYVEPFVDNNDELWLSGRLLLFQYKGLYPLFMLHDSLVRSDYLKLHQLKNGKLIFYSGKRVFAINGNNIETIFDADKIGDIIPIYAVGSDAHNNILIASQGGGFLVPTDTALPVQRFLPGIPLSHVFEDNEGNYWFTSITEGVYMLSSSARKVINFDKTSGLKSDKISSLFTYNDNVFFSSRNGIVSGWIGDSLVIEFTRRYTYYNLNSCMAVSNSLVHCLSNGGSEFLRNGQVPLFTNELIEYNAFDSLNLYNKIALPLGESFVVLGSVKMGTLDNQNRLWMAGINGLICMSIDSNKNETVYTRKHASRVTAICSTQYDSIWFATLDSIGLMASDGHISLTQIDSFGIAGYVTQLIEDTFQHLWFTTAGYGLYVYDGDTLYNFTTKDGLSDNFITTAKMHNGKLILGTTKGLSVATLTPDTPFISSLNALSINSALLSDEVNDLLVHGENLYVATNKGLSIVALSSFIGDTMIPKVYVTRMQINDRDTSVVSSYKLSYSLNSIKVEYLGLLYKADGNLIYRYQMQGIDTGWTQTSFTNVQYPALPPGKYTFSVDARSPQGPWSEKPATISITILPPFWQTWWFRTLLGLVSLATVTGVSFNVVRYYRNKSLVAQRMIELEGNALRANMNPHFVFNALNAIHDFIANSDERSAHLYLGKFAQLIRRILDQSRRNFISLEEEIDTLRLYLEL